MASKSRVRFADNVDTSSRIENEKGNKTSSFLITVNPNVVLHVQDSPEYIALRKKLQTFGNWFLKKKNLLNYLKFNNDWPRKVNLEKIHLIQDDRVATIEWGSKIKMLHMHIYVVIIHSTSVQIDCAKLREIGNEFFGRKIHINARGAGINFKNYTLKNIK